MQKIEVHIEGSAQIGYFLKAPDRYAAGPVYNPDVLQGLIDLRSRMVKEGTFTTEHTLGLPFWACHIDITSQVDLPAFMTDVCRKGLYLPMRLGYLALIEYTGLCDKMNCDYAKYMLK